MKDKVFVGDRRVVEVFSRALGCAEPRLAAAANGCVTRLPESIELVSPRELAWPMARLAASEALEAELCLAGADENPPLLAAARARSTRVRLLD